MEIKAIKNYEFKITNCWAGFSLIEIVVVLGILITIMVAVGGIMTSAFRSKNNAVTQQLILNESQKVMTELQKNVFEANGEFINCVSGTSSSISFTTKTGGSTLLYCDIDTGKVASTSAQNGSYFLTSEGIINTNCNNFVSCQFDSNDKVTVVNFNLNLGVTGGSDVGKTWVFVNKVVVR